MTTTKLLTGGGPSRPIIVLGSTSGIEHSYRSVRIAPDPVAPDPVSDFALLKGQYEAACMTGLIASRLGHIADGTDGDCQLPSARRMSARFRGLRSRAHTLVLLSQRDRDARLAAWSLVVKLATLANALLEHPTTRMLKYARQRDRQKYRRAQSQKRALKKARNCT